MASASSGFSRKRKRSTELQPHRYRLRNRSRSYEMIPPDLSELRVVLLGNSWSERSSVGNLLLGEKKFYTEEPELCMKFTKHMKDKRIILINTPNLFLPNISLYDLTKHVETCKRFTEPGPHVFLLVLQPGEFTEEHKQRLQTILKSFSDKSIDHSIVLISERREKSSGSVEQFVQYPALNDIIQKCKVKMLLKKSFERQQLLSVMAQMLEELEGEHVTCDVYEEASQSLPAGFQPKVKVQQESKLHKNSEPAHPIRIVLFGKSDDKKSTLGNTITGKKEFNSGSILQSLRILNKSPVSSSGEWNKKPVTVIKTQDLFSPSLETVRKEMKNYVSLCSPGPNVLLLLVRPSEFTEEDRKTLKFLLSLFDPDAFKHSMVIITHDEMGQNHSVEQLIKDCRQNHILERKGNQAFERQELMEKIETIVCENKGKYLTLKGDDSVTVFNESKPVLNLVLFGRRGAGKTSVVDAILRSSRFGPQPDSSQCVKHQGEVCGRWVSLLELPALCGKPEEAVRESFRCVSLCGPEGVHAFILVLPVAPLTDEDKGELQTIQDTFSPRVKDFTMILFTVDSDPAAPAVVDFIKETKEIQELCQSCGGRYFVLNTKDKKQILQLLETVDKMCSDSSRGFTKETLTRGNMERVLQLQAELQDVKHKVEETEEEMKKREEEMKKREEEMKKREEEMKKREEELKKNHREEVKTLRAQVEQERKQRVQQLKEKDECLEKEREKRKKEAEEEEKRRRKQEEAQRQEWKQKLEAAERKAQSERAEREKAEKKLEQKSREMKRNRDIWEKEKNQIWERINQEKNQNLEEEKSRYMKLQEEYHKRRRKWVYPWIFLFPLLLCVYLLFQFFTT